MGTSEVVTISRLGLGGMRFWLLLPMQASAASTLILQLPSGDFVPSFKGILMGTTSLFLLIL